MGVLSSYAPDEAMLEGVVIVHLDTDFVQLPKGDEVIAALPERASKALMKRLKKILHQDTSMVIPRCAITITITITIAIAIIITITLTVTVIRRHLQDHHTMWVDLDSM